MQDRRVQPSCRQRPKLEMRGFKVAQPHERALDALGLRKELGAFYTPPWMVEVILDHALEPVLDGLADPLTISVCDPACGAGVFLIGAARRIARRAGVSVGQAVDRCVLGVDLDPAALELARAMLCEAGAIQPQLCHTNGVAYPPVGIDVFIGNPPFRNVIERTSPSATRSNYPILGGTADLAFEFVAMASGHVKAGGRVGFVLPRAFLGATSSARLRASLHPRMIVLPTSARHFAGAAVFVALVVTGDKGSCLVAAGDSQGELQWREVKERDDNWWRLLHQMPPTAGGHRLDARFEVHTSLIAGEAYEIRDRIRENGNGMKLVTTGLIEPKDCLWGVQPCRFLGATYRKPTVDLGGISVALDRRVKRARRPKILVAGLSTRIEAFLDPKGETFGAVSTYTICHPEDDQLALEALLDHILSKEVTQRFRSELGASAMGGGSITLTKRFLQELSLPPAD